MTFVIMRYPVGPEDTTVKTVIGPTFAAQQEAEAAYDRLREAGDQNGALVLLKFDESEGETTLVYACS